MDIQIVDGDMVLVGGELQFVNGQEAIAQDISMALQTWNTESGTAYDLTQGVPYLDVIFGRKNPDLDVTEHILKQVILNRPGVLTCELALVFDRTGGVLTVTGTASTIKGNVDFSQIIKVAQ